MVVKTTITRQRILQNKINGLRRKGWDSNPRYPCGHAGFQDRCLKPLGHPSGSTDQAPVRPKGGTEALFARKAAAGWP